MERVFIGDLRRHIGAEVKIKGWLQTLRDQKKMQFMVIRDRTGLVQVAFEKLSDPGLAEKISTLGTESAVVISGLVVDNPIVKLGGLEIQLHSVDIESNAATPLPLDPWAETQPALDYRLDWRFLDLRRPAARSIFNVQTTVLMAMREFWVQNGFIEIHSPKLMGSASESGAEVFAVDYFERKAYLAQSPQFYKQMAMAAGFERVFEIGPAFRADPSFTSRHMTEFTSVDMEMSWISSHEDVMDFQERWLQYVYLKVKNLHDAEIKEHFGIELRVPSVPFPRIPMAKAREILETMDYKMPPEKKGDIDPEGERLIGKYVKEQFDHDFVFLTDWTTNIRPFYHMRLEENNSLTRSFDLIASGLEITTGAQREHRYDVLARQAQEKGLSLESVQFYLDFFRYGCPSHGGLGLGLSRLMMVMLNLNNVREAVYLFRGPTRLSP